MVNLNLEIKPKLEQKLTLTPELRQSLELLQYNVLELSEWIDNELIENPLLEKDIKKENEKNNNETDEKSKESNETLDENWDEYFNDGTDLGYSPHYNNDNNTTSFENYTPEKISLTQHLLNQLFLAVENQTEFSIGLQIITSLDKKGYLNTSIHDIANQFKIDFNLVDKIRKQIMQLDPIGIAAKNLQEFMLFQLTYKGKESSWAYKIVEQEFNLLRRNKLNELSLKLKITKQTVQKSMITISKLLPFPAISYNDNNNDVKYIIPDVIIKKIENEWMVIINDDRIPALKINNYYRNIIWEKNTDKKTKKFIKEKITSAKNLINAINQRHSTIFRVTSIILEKQIEFFEKGIKYLKPMKLEDISKIANLAESTISRTTNKKYAQTPYGIFELKFFFSKGIELTNGNQISAKVIKEEIKEIISKENSNNPISDTDIWKILKDKGIEIGRRAINKYREDLGILPKHLRKKFDYD